MNKLDMIKNYNEILLKIALNYPHLCDYIIYMLDRVLKAVSSQDINPLELNDMEF